MPFILNANVVYRPDNIQTPIYAKVVEICPISARKGQRYKIKLPDGSDSTVHESTLAPIPGGLTYGIPRSLVDVPLVRNLTAHALLYLPDDVIFTGERLYFRGDDRAPDNIFENGLQPRERHRSPLLVINTGDISVDSAVTFSTKPEVSGMFPLLKPDGSNRDIISYLYLFSASRVFDTKKLQKHLVTYPRNSTDAQHMRDMLPADEKAIAFEGVPGKTILCAWQIFRHWEGNTWGEGCTYTVMRQVVNTSWIPASSTLFSDWEQNDLNILFSMFHTKIVARMRKHSPIFS
jgi:hypothetical protein